MPAHPSAERRRITPRVALLVGVLGIAIAVGGVAVAARVTSVHLTANGHRLHPAGRLTTVGDSPPAARSCRAAVICG